MLKIFKRKDGNNYLLSIYEEKINDAYYGNETAYYGLEYLRNEKRTSLVNGWLLDKNEYVRPLELYELSFDEKNVLEELKKKIKRRMRFLNKKTNQILTQSDFLIIVLEREIEQYQKELNNLNLEDD